MTETDDTEVLERLLRDAMVGGSISAAKAAEAIVAAGWRPPEPQAAPVAAEVLKRAREVVDAWCDDGPRAGPHIGHETVERWKFARALLAEHARAEAAERERDTFKQHADNTRTQLHHWQDRAEAAERERDYARACTKAVERREGEQLQAAHNHTAEVGGRLLSEIDKVTARAEAAEATVAKIEAEARRYATMYAPHTDGRNTFVIFADWIAALSAPAAPTQKEDSQ